MLEFIHYSTLQLGNTSNIKYFSGSFEVQINDTLVHSKLASLAFPDYEDVAKNVELARNGEILHMKVKEQPITDCCIQ